MTDDIALPEVFPRPDVGSKMYCSHCDVLLQHNVPVAASPEAINEIIDLTGDDDSDDNAKDPMDVDTEEEK